MLGLYGSRVVQVTEKFKIGVIAATGGVCLVYLVDFVANFFGARLPSFTTREFGASVFRW